MQKGAYPMRLNKHLAERGYCSRREADWLIERGRVYVNGRKASLGDKVQATDAVEVRGTKRTYRYYAYLKPRGIITHSPQGREQEIADVSGLAGVFPVGRLDKDSYGLIILTDDGRVTDKLLNPAHVHEKEYRVRVANDLKSTFRERMERGVDIEGYLTKPCTVRILGPRTFSITLTEGKKHQIRRMCAACKNDALEIERVRIMNIESKGIPSGGYRAIEGHELAAFLHELGITP